MYIAGMSIYFIIRCWVTISIVFLVFFAMSDIYKSTYNSKMYKKNKTIKRTMQTAGNTKTQKRYASSRKAS